MGFVKTEVPMTVVISATADFLGQAKAKRPKGLPEFFSDNPQLFNIKYDYRGVCGSQTLGGCALM